MTPHHHGRHCHHHPNNLCDQTLNNPHCCSPCCYTCRCNSSCSPPPHAVSTDHLLQSMAANFFKTQSLSKPQQVHSQSLVHDLIRRVSALESSLSQLSSRAPSAPSDPPSAVLRRRSSPPSLREAAARTIQARFRRFLVRRSQTLRDLKRLGFIKSSAAALRYSISGDAEAEPDAISQEAMDLLVQLDSIQSSDPMIRDGKRSISREIARMIDFADNVLARERPPSRRAVEVVKSNVPLVQRRRSGRRVSFADNDFGIEEEAREGFSRVLEEKEEDLGNRNGAVHGQNGGYGLSAPKPIQMELRLGI